MLSILAKQLKTPIFRTFRNEICDIYRYLKFVPILQCVSARHYGIKPKQINYIEEDTLSSKILDYMRYKPGLTVSSITAKYEAYGNVNNAHTLHQMLLVISHSTELKTSDILRTFSLYLSLDQSVIKDIIVKKSLMMDVGKKVEQFIPFMTLADLRNFTLILTELQFKKNTYLKKIVTAIDSECERRALKADFNQCLELFDILILMHGNRIHRKGQFDIFMSLFEKHIESAEPINLVHILHYIGLGKKSELYQEFVVSVVKKMDKHYADLSLIDAGIAATGIFKAAVKLNKSSPFLLKVVDHLKMTLKNYSKLDEIEAYAFIGMIKVIRAARYDDDRNFLNSVSTFVMHADSDLLSSEVIAHILSLYTNMSASYPEVFTKMEHLTHQYLSSSSQLVRLKDLARVLWCFSHIRHKCTPEFFEVADKCIIDFLHNCGMKSYPEFLTGSLLSMAIMGHYPPQLIKEAFESQKIDILFKGYQRSKPLARLMMLHEAVKVEQPELLPALQPVSKNNLPTRTLAEEMRYRPSLATLMEGAQVINEMIGSCVFKLKFSVPYFNFASLVMNSMVVQEICSQKSVSVSHHHIVKQLCSLCEIHNESHIAIELLDYNSTVLNTIHPIGMVDMKFRLMKKSGWIIKMVREDEVLQCEGDSQAVAALILDVLDR